MVGQLGFSHGLWAAWSYKVQCLTPFCPPACVSPVKPSLAVTVSRCDHNLPTQPSRLSSLPHPLVPANWAGQCSQTDLFSPPAWLTHPPYCPHLGWLFLPTSAFSLHLCPLILSSGSSSSMKPYLVPIPWSHHLILWIFIFTCNPSDDNWSLLSVSVPCGHIYLPTGPSGGRNHAGYLCISHSLV